MVLVAELVEMLEVQDEELPRMVGKEGADHLEEGEDGLPEEAVEHQPLSPTGHVLGHQSDVKVSDSILKLLQGAPVLRVAPPVENLVCQPGESARPSPDSCRLVRPGLVTSFETVGAGVVSAKYTQLTDGFFPGGLRQVGHPSQSIQGQLFFIRTHGGGHHHRLPPTPPPAKVSSRLIHFALL